MTRVKNIKNIVCLQIIPTLSIGGIETGVRDISYFLTKNRIKNYILCQEDKNNLLSPNLNIVTLTKLKFKNPLDQYQIKKFLKNFIKKNKINLVHISSRAPAFYLIDFLKKLDVKVITSVHNIYKETNFIKSWYNSFLHKGDGIIYNSAFVGGSYKERYASSKKFIIHRGVDIEYFKSKQSNNLNQIEKYILLPSRVSSWKGHETLVKYFSRLPINLRKQFKIQSISLNKSRLEKQLMELIREFKLIKNVIILKPTLDIRDYYEKCYLVVNMSKRPEGFGRTVSEAMAMSKPVIAPNQGGTKEQLENFDKNLLFDVFSYDSFLESLLYALSNYEKIRKQSRPHIVNNYSSELMCKSTLNVYKKILTQ